MSIEIHTLAGAFALDALTDIERAEFSRHVASCRACSLEVAELRETAGRLTDLTAAAPPVGLRAGVLAEIARTPQEHRAPRAAGGSTGSSRWRRWTAAAVAAGVVAAGASAATWSVTEQRVRDERARAAEVTALLAAPDAVLRAADMAGGRVTLIVSPSRDRAVAVLDGLPEPSAGRTYQLWMIGTAPRSVGLVDAGTGTRVVPVDGASTFGVTLEPDGGSATPSDQIVGTVSL